MKLMVIIFVVLDICQTQALQNRAEIKYSNSYSANGTNRQEGIKFFPVNEAQNFQEALFTYMKGMNKILEFSHSMQDLNNNLANE